MLRLSANSFRKMRDFLFIFFCLFVLVALRRPFFDSNVSMAIKMYIMIAVLVLAIVIVCFCAKYSQAEITEKYAQAYDRIFWLISKIGPYYTWSDATSLVRKDYSLCRKNAQQFITIVEYIDELNYDTMRVDHYRLKKVFELSWHRDKIVRVTYMTFAVALSEGDTCNECDMEAVRRVASELPDGLFSLTADDLKMLHDQIVASLP